MDKTGGPAFACAAENGHQEGMKLRDWFAGQALIGMITFENGERLAHLFESKEERQSHKETGQSPQEYFASIAFAIADAMISEREKEAKEEKDAGIEESV